MLPWIQVYSNLPEHPKIYALVDRLGLKRNYEAVGIVVSLWLWAAKNAPEGDLSGFPDRAIAGAVGYPGRFGEKLCRGLLETGWLDPAESGGYLIHDWEENAAYFIQNIQRQRRKGRERVEKFRKKQAGLSIPQSPEPVGNSGNPNGSNPECNGKAAVTPAHCNAPKGQNINQTEPNGILSSGGGESSPSSWSKERLSAVFSPRLSLSDTALEELCHLTAGMEEGLLRRAVDIAQDNGKMVWPYVRGIFANWRQAGVRTVAQAEARERQRNEKPQPPPNAAGTAHAVRAEDVAESRRGMMRLRETLGSEI